MITPAAIPATACPATSTRQSQDKAADRQTHGHDDEGNPQRLALLPRSRAAARR